MDFKYIEKMIKEDYMKLSKERLAELLVEKDRKIFLFEAQLLTKQYTPGDFFPFITEKQNPPCWAPGGYCSNPFHDCINCPQQWGGGGTISTTSTGTGINVNTKVSEITTIHDDSSDCCSK